MITNKKIIAPISLSMALLLMTPSVMSAARLDDFVMSTSTSAGSWTDPLGGGTYLYGGDFKLKLKSSAAYAPLLQFKEPSIKMGCSGISIEGGFLAYLGLDKLQDMLANAGSSLVMGIILGLEFTLPAISAVFAKIRAWANALQALLQNGCNIGKMIGKMGAASGAFNTGLSDAINGPFADVDKFISGGDGALKALEGLANCSGELDDPNCSLKNAMNKAFGDKIKEDALTTPSAAAAASSVTSRIFNDSAQPSTKDIVLITDLKKLYGNNSIGCSITTTKPSDEEKLFDALKFVFFGDIGVDYDFLKSYESKLDSSGCEISQSFLSKVGQDSVTTGNKAPVPTPLPTTIEPLITDPKDAASLLMYGAYEISDSYTNITGISINIPNRKIIYFDIADGKNEAKEAIGKYRVSYLSGKTESDSAYTIEWSGVFKESLKAIRTNISAATGFTTAGMSYEKYDTSSTILSSSTPLLLPSLQKYQNIIAKIELRAGKATPQSEMLKVNLAKANSILYAKELMGAIESRVLSLMNGAAGEITAINNMARHIREVSKEIKKIIKEMEDDIGSTKFMEEFEKIEKSQKLESVKSNR